MNVFSHQQFFTLIPVTDKKAKIKQNSQTFFKDRQVIKKLKSSYCIWSQKSQVTNPDFS